MTMFLPISALNKWSSLYQEADFETHFSGTSPDRPLYKPPWVTAETISKNMGSLGDSNAENRGSLEPYIRVTSIMGVPPSPGHSTLTQYCNLQCAIWDLRTWSGGIWISMYRQNAIMYIKNAIHVSGGVLSTKVYPGTCHWNGSQNHPSGITITPYSVQKLV